MSDEFVFVKPGEGKKPSASAKSAPVAMTPDVGTNPAGDDFFFVGKSDQKKKADEGDMRAAVAGTGALMGGYLRHKGVEAKNILTPGQGTYQPSEKSIYNINTVLRQRTGDPTIDVRGMTADQVNRILSGGEGPTLGTSGRQRAEGFSLESQRRARVQQEIEDLVNRLYPQSRDPLASVNEPMVPLKSNIIVPQSTATQQAERQTTQQIKLIEDAQRAAKTSGLKAGAGKVGMGVVGGGLTGLQAYQMATQPQPSDWTQYLSLLGNLGITFGGPRLGTVGGLAQIPYAVKHREEIARGMGLGEINPTAFGGAPEALETPIGSAMRKP